MEIGSETREGTPLAKCDVAFVIALPEEAEELDLFGGAPLKLLDNDQGLEIKHGNIALEDHTPLSAHVLLLGDQGADIAGIQTTAFLHLVKPTILFVLGISGRIDDDCFLGDVVLASVVDDAMYRVKQRSGERIAGGKEFRLEALARRLDTALRLTPPFLEYSALSDSERVELQRQAVIGPQPKIWYGPICTTPYLVDDKELADWLKYSRNRNFLATDMETAAIVQAAYQRGIRDGRVVVIRGISDPADGSKKGFDAIGNGSLRRAAMKNASQVANYCISHLIEFSDNNVTVKMNQAERELIQPFLTSHKYAIQAISDIVERINAGEKECDACKSVIVESGNNPSLKGQIVSLAEDAFKTQIDRERVGTDALLSSFDPTGVDYLVARWIVECLSERSLSHHLPNVLGNVYPQRVNRFCKALVSTLPDELKLVETLTTAYTKRIGSGRNGKTGEKQVRAKAHIVYLMGRLRSPQNRKRASEAMIKWRLALNRRKGETSREYALSQAFSALPTGEKRLLLRSICISLILLEQPGESEIYVEACIRNKEFDSLNRGFHLEYYGDIDYDPREMMQNEDPITCPISKTFEILYTKITSSLINKRSYPLRDVELQTLLSLCQHRHAKRNLDDDYRLKILELLARGDESPLTENTVLQAYCESLREHFQNRYFRQKQLISKLFNLKKLPRSGWNDCDDTHYRETNNPESVLSHTAGGLLLIQFFLPDRLSKSDIDTLGSDYATKYSKQEISKYFLLHDLAESYTGDLLPRERNDQKKAEERRANSHIDLFSTWPDYREFGFFESWRDFDKARTINGKVAREIDALDNLIQLDIETNNNDAQISDLATWRSELIQRIDTPMCKRILAMIMEE